LSEAKNLGKNIAFEDDTGGDGGLNFLDSDFRVAGDVDPYRGQKTEITCLRGVFA